MWQARTLHFNQLVIEEIKRLTYLHSAYSFGLTSPTKTSLLFNEK